MTKPMFPTAEPSRSLPDVTDDLGELFTALPEVGDSFVTSTGDDRVTPVHARKMAARLQEAQGDKTRPILLRVETKAGHGAGKPVSKLTDELADELAFLFRELGLFR